MEDEEIVARLLRGDGAPVEELRRWIRASARVYTPQLSAEMEDVEQEVLFEITRALRNGRFERKSRLRTYLGIIVHHKCIDRLRARQRRQWVSLDDLELAATSLSPLEQLAVKQRLEIAARVIQRLPEACVRLWELLQQGLSYRVMSQRLGVPEPTLRSRVLRCRQQAVAVRGEILRETVQRNTPSDD